MKIKEIIKKAKVKAEQDLWPKRESLDPAVEPDAKVMKRIVKKIIMDDGVGGARDIIFEIKNNLKKKGKMKEVKLMELVLKKIDVMNQYSDLYAEAAFNCECLNCGFKTPSETHCKETPCPKCGGPMRRADRPGRGQ